MSRCGCSSQCSCAITGGENVTVAGTGAPGNPYVISVEAGGALQVTDTPTVDLTLLGSGTASDPHILSAAARVSGTAGNLLTEQPDGLAVTCEDVQDCVGETLTDGLEYDDAANEIRVRVSGQPNNSVSIGPDGGLYAPVGGGNPVATTDTDCISLDGDGAGTPLSASPILDPAAGNLLGCGTGGLSATIATGCGLAGDGTAAAPLEVATAAWPYACDPAAEGGVVTCDASGVLRGEPPSQFWADSVQANNSFAPVAAPGAFTTVATASLDYTNPSPCKEALALIELEVDVDFNLPAGAQAAYRFGGDTMWDHENRGSGTQFAEHTQTTKVAHVIVPPGTTQTFSTDIQVQGSGGATYQRIQYTVRAWVFAL